MSEQAMYKVNMDQLLDGLRVSVAGSWDETSSKYRATIGGIECSSDTLWGCFAAYGMLCAEVQSK